MDLFKKEKINRRNFIKKAGIAGAAVCSACFSLGYSKKNSEKNDNGKAFLAAACGTYCGACPAYLAKHSEDEQIRQKRLSPEPTKAQKGIPPSSWMKGLLCDGCLSGGQLAGHCQNCSIRLHALETQKDARCTYCEELPCYRITNLINMGGYLHRQEYLPNLKKIHEIGVREWVKYEEERWRCPRCGNPMSWYDAECIKCEAPRSERLFSLF
ncbi:MAG: DUF3795 domain-containing protein [Bacteroidetes bacterium]|nr:DUF3795 domain-containing protein [Bacteroidota bacterium]